MKTDITSVLWDVKKEKISTLSRDFIVRRALAYGTVELILQLIRESGVIYVRDVFNSLKPTSFSKKKHLYLKNYLLK